MKPSIFIYKGDNEDEPSSFTILDKDKRVLKKFSSFINELETYKNRKFDKNGNLIYAIIEEEYYPTKWDFELYSAEEINEKRINRKAIKIREIEYVYY